MFEAMVAVADSWLVTDGTVLALEVHHSRFLAGITGEHPRLDPAGFWDAVLAQIPRTGDWFPRVELQLRDGAPSWCSACAPPRTHEGGAAGHHRRGGPANLPLVKGPDTAALLRLRTEAQGRGADEAVILSPEGFVIEGAYSSLLWWRGEFLCAPSLDLDRVDSVTARSVIALATALGTDVHYESVTPRELDGLEIWALNALQGIRIVTAWIDGPEPAELPGRLALWRARLDRLRKPLPGTPTTGPAS